ncbi:MAG: hypothetical protein JSW26_00695 [Desulfobacterales bacterium]|nr:MAG: hypothetical protein JSW26_00695 [Desulfobacterales bacterium]
MNLFLERFFRAVKLDASLYEEIVADAGAMNQALIVVFIYGMATAFGSFGRTGTTGINIGIITTLLGWYVWAFMAYIIGARLLPEAETKTERKAVVRAMGFAAAPGLARLLGFVPGLGGVAVLVSSVWMVAAATVALKKALNYQNTPRALGVSIVSWILSALVQGLLYVVLFSVFGVPAN